MKIKIKDGIKTVKSKMQKSTYDARSYLDIAGVMIVAINTRGIVTLINKRGCEILGYKESEIIGKNWFDNFLPERLRKEVKDISRKLLSGEIEQTEYFENPILTKSGKERMISWHNTMLKDEKGKLVGHLSSGEDITERKKTELALKESEKRFRQLAENAQEWIWEVSISGLYTYSNQIVKNILGYEPEEIVGKKHFYDFFYPKDKVKLKKGAFETFAKHQPFRKFVNRNIHKNGTIVWLSTSGVPIFDDKGSFVGYRGVDTDITNLKKAGQKLETLNKALLQMNRKLKQMVVKDSHTGLYNHRYLEEAIKTEFDRAKRHVQPLSIAMIDLDYFKSINDVYGHQFGDVVLKQFAAQIKKIVRRYDVVVRFGGEEFVILFPETGKTETIVLCRRILDSMNKYNFGNKQHTIKLKLSIAVSAFPEDNPPKAMDLLEICDKILNKAKEYGGNRVFSSSDIKKEKKTEKEKATENPEVKNLKEKLSKLDKRANQSLMEAVFAFAKTIELKDNYTGRHVQRTVLYATQIAEKLKLPSEEIERIKKAAILHDLGKIGISEKLLRKKSSLTKKEFEEIKKHPQIGVDILRPIYFLHDVIPFMLHHHEKWNGKGYPDHLKGKDIPMGARIISLADAYQALTSRRAYRKSYSKEEAIRIIRKGAGVNFDPAVVKVFIKILKHKK